MLVELGLPIPAQLASIDTRDESWLWAASGAQYLTGDSHGPPLPSPAPLATCAQGSWLALAALSAGVLDYQFPAYQLLGERAAVLGLQRRGAISAGGACHLLDCADGQLALNLPRDDDWALLPAWLECSAEDWVSVARVLRSRSCVPMVARARLLGLAAAPTAAPVELRDWYASIPLARGAQPPRRQPLVIDLSALWAGPLCAQLLGQLGARVIKIEDSVRPDGARAGAPRFFDLLNANKQSVALDLTSASGRRQLHQLLARADIIIESSRPRALEQMGIQATNLVRAGDGRVWLSITGYGRRAPMREWIAFGDDAGVAAGLSWLLRKATGSVGFCADAIADPLTGLHAALLTWATWIQGGGALLDVSLTGVVARCIAAGRMTGQAGPPPLAQATAIVPPRARPAAGRAATLGFHTASVLREMGIT